MCIANESIIAYFSAIAMAFVIAILANEKVVELLTLTAEGNASAISCAKRHLYLVGKVAEFKRV